MLDTHYTNEKSSSLTLRDSQSGEGTDQAILSAQWVMGTGVMAKVGHTGEAYSSWLAKGDGGEGRLPETGAGVCRTSWSPRGKGETGSGQREYCFLRVWSKVLHPLLFCFDHAGC